MYYYVSVYTPFMYKGLNYSEVNQDDIICLTINYNMLFNKHDILRIFIIK